MSDSHLLADGKVTAEAAFLPLKNWVVEGLRAGFFLPPRTAGRSPVPLQALLIFVVYFTLDVALSRLQVVGPARFDTQAWLSGWWSSLVFVGAAWWAFSTPATNAVPGALVKLPDGYACASHHD